MKRILNPIYFILAVLFAAITPGMAANCPDGSTQYVSSIDSLTISVLTASFTSPTNCGTAPYSFSVSNATSSVTLPSPLATETPLNLNGVTASWEETDQGVVSDRVISWTGELEVLTLHGIKFSLTDVSFQESPQFSAEMTLKAEVEEEVAFRDVVYVQPAEDLGDVTITYNEDGTVSFDYSGLSGIAIELKPNGTKVAEISVDTVTQEGVLQDVTLTALPNVDFESAGFTAQLQSLSLVFDYDIPNTNFTYKSSSGTLALKEIGGLEEDFNVTLTIDDDSAEAALATEEAIKAFGFEITGDITFNFNHCFEMNSITASGLSITRTDNDDFSLTGVSFEISDGDLQSLSAGSSSVKYKQISFELQSASYESGGSLEISATLELPSVQLTVDGFAIATDATVSIESVALALNQTPLSISGDATFGESEFRVDNLDITFAGTGIQADVVIGATSFNYGYAALKVSGNGVALGSSGLKLKTISGKGGYNYYVDSSGSGSAQEGALCIGFGIGISDIGDAILLEGNAAANLGGGDVVLSIDGSVKAPADPAHYFSSALTVNYSIYNKTVSGDLTTSVSLPRGSGSVLNMNNATMTYSIGGGNWSLAAPSVSGLIFNRINYDSSFNASSSLAGSGFSGSVNGSIDYYLSKTMAYPSNFQPDGSNANIFGFGFYGTLELELDGNLNASLNSSGITGSLSASASGSSDLTVKWPQWFWEETEVHTYSCSGSGTLTIEKQASNVRIHGEVTLTSGDESETADIDVTV